MPLLAPAWWISFKGLKYVIFGRVLEIPKGSEKILVAPLLIMTVLFGVLLIMAESSALAPFIYTLF